MSTEHNKRKHEKIVCPICHTASTKESWNEETWSVWPNAAPLEEAVLARHVFGDKHYICPVCEFDHPVRELIHEHKE